MGKSIARGCKKSLVDQCYEDPVTRGIMMKKLEIVLKREMNVMCEVKTGSILRSGLWDHMTNFKWQSVIDEMKLHTPVLFGILNSCTLTKNKKSNRNATIGICTSILLKYWCHHMSLVQKIIMLLLYGSNCGKQASIQCVQIKTK